MYLQMPRLCVCAVTAGQAGQWQVGSNKAPVTPPPHHRRRSCTPPAQAGEAPNERVREREKGGGCWRVSE